MEARLAAEREAEARRLREWHLHPPPGRELLIRRRCRLPRWTPAGLDHLRLEEAFRPAAERLMAHRECVLAGGRPERGLWICGPTDRRKTAMTAAFLFDVAHRAERPALMWNVADLLEELGHRAGGRESEYSERDLEDAQFLALDDLGTLKVTDFAWKTLFRLVNDAYDAWGPESPRTLYVTSNEDPVALQRLLSTPDRPDGGDRIVRRLVQLCDVVEV
jgi:DNA replication protein DnaC